MYTKVPTSLNFVDREKEILQFWKENRIFEKSCELRKGRPAYTFYDGPPTANGKPHIGHILTRARPAGIRTDCRLNWKLKKCWGLTAKNR